MINDTEINLEFTWVQVFHAFGENSSICAAQRLLGFQESFSVPCAKLGEEGTGSGSHHLLRKSPGFLVPNRYGYLWIDDHPPRTQEIIRNPTFDHDINHTNGILNGLV